jgi:acyl carrier protein phosphodiesterase
VNYLAHLFLADSTPASMTGNLMADFVKGDAMLTLPPEVQAGVRQHRAIDRFTDTPPDIK